MLGVCTTLLCPVKKFLVVTNSKSNVVSIYEWLNGSFSVNLQDIKIKQIMKCTTFGIDEDTYMACGSFVPTDATIILKWNGTGFDNFQILPSSEVRSPHSIEANGSVFLAVPSYDSRPPYIYRWNGASFDLHQSLTRPGTTPYADLIESFIIEDETFLTVCNYQNVNEYSTTDEYKMTGSKFTYYQRLTLIWAKDLVSYTYMGRRYLVIAKYANHGNYNTNSPGHVHMELNSVLRQYTLCTLCSTTLTVKCTYRPEQCVQTVYTMYNI